ncbi:PH domain-containing protein [Streptomyces somaliensis DSM 40738]|uniref:PH domain-containing protein n=1 Tax=Streptomyces somaliensis (strain ATCC 33201 / DSM 40738 / JCM 12659 / KCTC 9044 / NCTC 11332 / NRRL B-12077 / IP 733) TaxID=1134445 RepID=A0AA44DD07_STRE0|nr:PH domain-containing protein [Streptomyces somaliensis]MCQ0023975.1 PH domain-containing protein [Streptomyces somaliensis DSM 40738]NKY14234.1 PH domain-containing protein [Streptomyces somaliensis DSM 40738]
MTSPERPGESGTPYEPAYADRSYRSPMAMAGGALLLGIGLWMGGDALLRGDGRTPWTAAAALLLGVPLVVAFTFRPAVFAGDDRMRVRNPFRTIVLPWAAVATVRATYSTEVVTRDGTRYQLWAVPVSMRQRKRAARGGDGASAGTEDTLRELRELAERNAARPTAGGEPEVRWAYEVIAPALLGLAALVVLLATG